MDEKTTGYALGASEYMTKPIDRDKLSTVLKKFCDRSSTRPVLIVEDDDGDREMVRRLLVKDGLKVLEARNGREALERMSETLPSVIVLDLLMPEMDGFDFVSEMHEKEEWRSIPVVVLTAKDITEQDRLRLDGYVEAVMNKNDYSREELVREMRDLVTRLTQQRTSA